MMNVSGRGCGMKKALFALFVLSMLGGFGVSAFANAGYFNELLTREANNSDGVNVIMYLMKLEDRIGDHKDNVALLKEKGIIRDREIVKANVPLRRGLLAYWLVRALDIQGGVIMRWTGRGYRYAYRECVFLELMAEGSEKQNMTGPELVSVLARARNYQNHGHAAYQGGDEK